MRLSILIPVYNVNDYLSDLLKNLASNLLPDIELIFYDDASTDNSAAQIQNFKISNFSSKIRLLQGSKNVGLTCARDILINASEGEYIWFIDADDKVETTFFDNIMFILKKNNPDVLLFDYDVFFDETKRIKNRESLMFYPKNQLVYVNGKQIYQTAVLDGKHYFWNKIFKKELILGKVEYTIPAYEDIAYTPILLNQCKSFYYFTQTVLHYRIRNNSIAQKMSVKQAYGIEAYIGQAKYAAEVVKDRKSQAYLLYKASVYYYRMLRKIRKLNIPEHEKVELVGLSNQLFNLLPIPVWKLIIFLFIENMQGKALKLFMLFSFFKIKHFKLL